LLCTWIDRILAPPRLSWLSSPIMHTSCPTHYHCSPRLYPLNLNDALLLQDSLNALLHSAIYTPHSTHTY
jgi:hypothetical protein